MTFNVGSEVGQLREAIVHRPGLELSRLTPDNIESLLFDDVMWASKAQEEHDAFTQALRDKGVLVHHYGLLLACLLYTSRSSLKPPWPRAPTTTRSAVRLASTSARVGEAAGNSVSKSTDCLLYTSRCV